MKNDEPASGSPASDNPLDRPLDGPIAPIPGLDIDPDEEATNRVWGPTVFGIRRHRPEHPSSEFERVVEYTDWRAGAEKEGPYSKGHARGVYRGSDRIDAALGIPGLALFAVLLDKDWENGFLIGVGWIVALAIWTPWTLWRVWAPNPKGDVGRAGRRLAAAWALLLVLVPASMDPIAMTIACTLVYAGGLVLMYLALSVPAAGGPHVE